MNLLKAASTVSLLTLASRVTGLAREWVVATQFGASAWTDAFNVAFRIPNLLRRLFAEGAFSQAFVPLLGEAKAREGDVATARLVSAVASVLLAVLLLTVVLGVAGAPVLVWIMASGLAELDEAVWMTRLMFPYIGFMALVALAARLRAEAYNGPLAFPDELKSEPQLMRQETQAFNARKMALSESLQALDADRKSVV